ncbi:hypothetical protein TNCV_446671 [Trichonephila clavipes]|nr:hypothetical protein TNCV_446671 [Trichonephila clavipes]
MRRLPKKRDQQQTDEIMVIPVQITMGGRRVLTTESPMKVCTIIRLNGDVGLVSPPSKKIYRQGRLRTL